MPLLRIDKNAECFPRKLPSLGELGMRNLYFAALIIFPCVARTSYAASDETSAQLTETVASVFHSHSQAAGIIELSGCKPLDVHVSPKSGSDITSQLNSLSHLSPLRWSYKNNIYLVEILELKQSSIMNVQLPPIEIPNGGVVPVANVLFQNQSVQREAERLGLRLYDGSVGFSSLPTPTDNNPRVLKIPAGTLSDDLNWLVSRKANAIWLYRQSSCRGRKIGVLSWAYR